MGFKDILVTLDGGKGDAARLELAVFLARRWQAHLIGLHVRAVVPLPEFIMAEYGGQISQLQEQYADETAAVAKGHFDAATANSGLSLEWREPSGLPHQLIPQHARYADLTVIGQDDVDFDDGDPLVDLVILQAGRPVLVVPSVGRYPEIGKVVMVAWNASRESSRAVADAMPLLRQAKQVRLLSINGQEEGDLPGADIAAHLARHGVPVVTDSLRADDLSVGPVLLSRLADADADLLVMGAYGHSRLRELVLGGATRQILKQMTVPVLFSH